MHRVTAIHLIPYIRRHPVSPLANTIQTQFRHFFGTFLHEAKNRKKRVDNTSHHATRGEVKGHILPPPHSRVRSEGKAEKRRCRVSAMPIGDVDVPTGRPTRE